MALVLLTEIVILKIRIVGILNRNFDNLAVLGPDGGQKESKTPSDKSTISPLLPGDDLQQMKS